MIHKITGRSGIIISTFILFFICSAIPIFAQGTVEGKVIDTDGKPIISANVFFLTTTIGSSTDLNGNYRIIDIPEGNYTMRVSSVGYKTKEIPVTIKSGVIVKKDVTLENDILNFESVVVTGSRNPQKKIESSIAITTLNPEQIREEAPRNTAELLTAIPGFYVESSGGEGGNNLFARGIPADGSYRYVQMQEDGLPVFEDGELMFANVDVFMRVDETIASMEGVRGSTGSIFASNSPGGIINFISKTGGNKLSGIVKTTVGDYGMYRTDIDYGGPLGENWRFNVGGFYRSGEGVRPAGFVGNEGGQLKANVTRLLDKGYFRLNYKYLNDRNIFYLPVPLQNKDNPEPIPGFNANYGTMTTFDAEFLRVKQPDGGLFERSLDDGMHPIINAFGGELYYEFDNGWAIKNSFRNTMIDHTFNAIFSLSDPVFADKFAQDRFPAGAVGYRYSYAHSGDVINNPLLLNGNGLVAETGWWAVNMKLRNFVNHSQLTKKMDNHSFTLGLYFSDYKASSFWFWHNMLTEVKDAPKLLNLEALDVSGKVITSITDNGFTRYGSNYLNDAIQTTVAAGYLNDEWHVSPQLRIDGGIRYEYQRSRGTVENVGSYNMGDPTTLADDNVSFGTGRYRTFDFQYHQVAISVGGNYTFTPNLALYARGSSGFRTPDDNQIFFSLNNPATIVVEDIVQFEGGVKYSSPHFALFAAGFYNTFKNIPFSDEVVGPDGTIITSLRFAGSRTIGLELEAIFKYEGFELNFTGTAQDPKYKDFGHNTDNQVRRIPKLYFTVSPSYTMGAFKIFGSARYFSQRFTDDANKGILPSFTEFNAGASYKFSKRITLSVHGSNLTNTIGLTEGNPRVDSQTDPRNFFFMARPILGRSATVSLAYVL